MCFNHVMSGSFSVGLLLIGIYMHWRTGRTWMCGCVYYFMLMEFLQFLQHFDLAESLDDPRCRTWTNQFLTILGYLHIAFQPFVFNKMYATVGKFKHGAFRRGRQIDSSVYDKSEAYAWEIVARMCLVQSLIFIVRLVLSPGFNSDQLSPRERSFLEGSRDWMEGRQMCTYQGVYHLAWSLPLPEPTYYLPGLGLHCFMMFAPALCITPKTFWFDGFLIFLSGPVLSSLITDNLHEQASIWCFGSIAQLGGVILHIWLFTPKDRWPDYKADQDRTVIRTVQTESTETMESAKQLAEGKKKEAIDELVAPAFEEEQAEQDRKHCQETLESI